MKAGTETLTTTLSTDVKTDFKAYCENNGLKINRTIERLIISFLKSKKGTTEESRPPSAKIEGTGKNTCGSEQ